MSQNLPLQIKNLVHPNDVEIPYLKRPLPSPPIEIEKRICLDQGYQEIITFPISPISPTVAFPITNRPIAQPIPRKPIVKKPSHMISDCGKRIWELIRSIGKGGCGEVYLGKELNKPNQVVAVKIIKDRKQFLSELNTMKLLHHNEQGRGYTPKLLCALKKRKTLVMELLGDTVALKFEQARYKFSLKTIVMLALNMMSLTKDFNEKTGQAHVDMKPSNICTSQSGKELFLIDFGYSTSPLVKLPGQTGTPLFMSWTLQTIDPSVQDDLESIGYVIMFFLAGGKKGLPWGHLRTHVDIAAAKNDVTIGDFCQSLSGTEYEPIADALQNYLYIVRDKSRPFTWEQYQLLYQEFENVLYICGWTNDGCYDWVDEKQPQLNSTSTATLLNPEPTRMIEYAK